MKTGLSVGKDGCKMNKKLNPIEQPCIRISYMFVQITVHHCVMQYTVKQF